MNPGKCFVLLGLCMLLAIPAQAADFPNRSITVNNAWVPGGIVEMSYRPVGDELAKLLGTNVVLNPASGAGGLMGVNKTLQGRKDGYNLLLTSDMSVLALSKLRNSRWNYHDFVPIGSYGTTLNGLAVKKGDPRFSNLEEFIAYAKAHPGELSVGQAGMLSTEHVGSAMARHAMGVDYKFVPFDGSLPAAAACAGGHIDAVFTPRLFHEGLQPLAVSTETRSKDFPDIPTFKEKGFDVIFSTNYGLFARKGTPEEQIAVLRDAMNKAVHTEANLNNLPRVRMSPIFYNGEDWAKLMDQTGKTIDTLVEQKIITPENSKKQ